MLLPIEAQQFVEDLLWTIQSPSLFTPEIQYSRDGEIAPATCNQLYEQFSNSRPYKVGRYFESLVEFWLRHIRQLKIVEQQKQIFEGTRTLGEIDFIYKNELGETVHLETAVKFYLHYAGEHRSSSHFIGPNSNDNLEAKHNKLFQHQLKLGREHFADVGKSEAFVKGRIFYHGNSQRPAEVPSFLATDHLSGHWVYAYELEWLDEFGSDAQFFTIRKPHWLADVRTVGEPTRLLPAESLRSLVQNHFEDSIRPLLIAHVDYENDCWVEESRFFIVNSGWPHLKNR